ncbi:MAG TPA: head GIN domain-containing protein [Flavisolibacter sp.]|nr:head GIN domain-containing protein [Flavisolibacter sp.]
MRKTMLTVAAALCLSVSVNAQKEKQETIEGNGNLVTKEIPVSSFETLKASGIYELKLVQGGAESVKVEADENLHQYFNVRNEGNTLVIDMKGTKNKNMKLKNKMKVYVSFKKLTEMDLSMVGDVKAETPLNFANLAIKNSSVGNVQLNLSATTLNVTNNSVGHVKLHGKAENAVVKNNGVGDFDAGDLVVQTMRIDNSGVGDAEVHATKELTVSDSMLGGVKNKGGATVKKNKKVRI